MTETDKKKCAACGRELPLSEFQATKWGAMSVCRECVTRKKRKTARERRARAAGGVKVYSDPDFDGKDPVEVVQMMTRAKKWLESRGYEIHLEGFYNVRRQVRFQL